MSANTYTHRDLEELLRIVGQGVWPGNGRHFGRRMGEWMGGRGEQYHYLHSCPAQVRVSQLETCLRRKRGGRRAAWSGQQQEEQRQADAEHLVM